MEETATIRSDWLFPAKEFNPRPIVIGGLGAGGSHAAMALGKLGVSHMVGCDFDTVSLPNVGPSIYGPRHVGMKKALACPAIIAEHTAVTMEAHECRMQDLLDLGRVAFICVDNMDERKEILLEHCVPRSKLGAERRLLRVIEGRMSADTLTVHSIDPGNQEHVCEWLRYWFPQSAALPALPGCGAQAVSADYTAGIVGRIMARMFVEWFAYSQKRILHCHNQVRYDLSTFEGSAYFW